MKKISISLLSISVLLGVLLAACRKDDSTFATSPIPSLTFGHELGEQLTVYQFQNLKVDPAINYDGSDKSKYKYLWQINRVPNDTGFITIGEGELLDYEIAFTPNTGTQKHILKLEVTNIEKDLEFMHYWEVVVLNNIGEGLVIATTKDGINTDVSHIMSPEVTTGYAEVSIKRDIVSSVNGSPISGLAKSLYFANVRGGNRLYALTENNIHAYQTLSYSYVGDKNELFVTPPSSVKPGRFYYSYQSDVYIGDGKAHYGWFSVAPKIGVQNMYESPVPEIVAINANSQNASTYEPTFRMHYYDEVNEKFAYVPGVGTASFLDRQLYFSPDEEHNGVNAGNYPGKENVAAGISVDRGYLHVLKDKATGAFELVVFNQGVNNYGEPYVAPSALKKVDLSTAPEIGNAKHFLLLDDQSVLLYATDTKLYAVLYAGVNPIFQERYAVTSGETITTLNIYRQHGYPNQASYIATNNKQLILSTYNGNEGKVRLLPLINQGAANIDNSNIKTFEGFDKILCITPQK